MNNHFSKSNFLQENIVLLVSLIFTILIAAYIFYDSIENMVRYWYGHEEFGHAFILPFISIYLIWQKKGILTSLPVTKAWVGLLLVVLSICLFIIGLLSAIFVIQQYALVLLLIGLFVSVFGVEISRKVTIPLLLLVFMIPLPGFLYNSLSSELQLISSILGVWFIRLFDISVFLEGNVIDLGVYKLQVVEACSGLRYLFPLMTLGLIASYIYRSSVLNKVIVFLSTIPITVFMNSFRIGMIGVLVEYYGISMAEGFLHDFEGWIIFMACTALLIIEMWLLSKLSRNRVPFSELFNFDFVESENKDTQHSTRKFSQTAVLAFPILLIGLIASHFVGERENIIPDRTVFAGFPNVISNYTGKKEVMEAVIIDALNFDDYLMTNYWAEGTGETINVYIGYYDIQRTDKVPHSPKACLPGGGWLVTKSDIVDIESGLKPDHRISVNRVVIDKSGNRQLVYYWFKQRNRYIADEYSVKWYLLVDSITRNRSDGALVRFVTLVKPGEDLSVAEARLGKFIMEANPILTEYLPD